MGELKEFEIKDNMPLNKWVERFENIWHNQGKDAALAYGKFQIPKQLWKSVNEILRKRRGLDDDGYG